MTNVGAASAAEHFTHSTPTTVMLSAAKHPAMNAKGRTLRLSMPDPSQAQDDSS